MMQRCKDGAGMEEVYLENPGHKAAASNQLNHCG